MGGKMGGMMGGMMGGGAASTLLTLVFLAVLVGGAIWFFRNRKQEGSSLTDRLFPRGTRGTDAALQVLQERFARGEMTRAEYDETGAVLRGGTPPTPRASTSRGPQHVEDSRVEPTRTTTDVNTP